MTRSRMLEDRRSRDGPGLTGSADMMALAELQFPNSGGFGIPVRAVPDSACVQRTKATRSWQQG
jgi:hypothetical protein